MNLDDIPDSFCEECGKPYDAKRYDQRFCGTACHRVYWGRKVNQDRSEAARVARSGYVCPECGITFDAKTLSTQIYCSKRCKTREMQRRFKARLGPEEYLARQRLYKQRWRAKKREEALKQ